MRYNLKRRFTKSIRIGLWSLIFVSLIPLVSASAFSFDRKAGSTWSSGGGVTTTWDANAGDGTLKSRVTVTRNWYHVLTGSIGKSQSAVCKKFTPNFTGTARVKMTAVLNGELRAESKSFWKVPGGTASADVHLLLQINGNMYNQGLMIVVATPFPLFPKVYTYNNETKTFEVKYAVKKGQQIEVCAGMMTNASVVVGGGDAYSDFASSRFARTYVSDLSVSQ